MKIAIILSLLFVTTCTWSKNEDLRTVDHVEVSRYVGKWYAISALPQFFTRKCIGQTAEYEIINPQTISVLNTCLKGKGQTTITGEAVVENAATNAELTVRFNNFFTRLFRVKGDYNIIALDSDYKYVTVASRDRKSLWIMSRTPTMPKEIYEEYVNGAKAQNFPVEKLVISRFR
jgi:apolipoprotein D and lipocalin family protein